MNVGIDAIHFYVPNLYLPVKDLAKQRNIDPAKLEKGLGLIGMAITDTYEDTATLAANAANKLIQNQKINLQEIHRIYVGTESALDNSKPVATYVMQMLESQMGAGTLNHVDATDLTFACVGGIDALQNCVDFVRLNPDKKAIVIATDYAKYALNSTGEYTQGAGAVALLVSSNPRILALDKEIGIATSSVFDFFKPRRQHFGKDVIDATSAPTQVVEIHTDEPIFDGQYSNACYKARLKEAYFSLKSKSSSKEKLYETWDILAFHLPYAFQGKRMFSEIFGIENGIEDLSSDNLKHISKSEAYQDLVRTKIEPTQRASSAIGNMYTASIFMALLSALEVARKESTPLAGKKVGLLAYGSGSKSKVWEGTLQEGWKKALAGINLFETLAQRQAIDYQTYEKLHRKSVKVAINKAPKGFGLQRIEQENPLLLGARYYDFLG